MTRTPIRIYSEEELKNISQETYKLFINGLPKNIQESEMESEFIEQPYIEYEWNKYSSSINDDGFFTRLYFIRNILDFAYLMRIMAYCIGVNKDKNYKLVWFKKPKIMKESFYLSGPDLERTEEQKEGYWLEFNFRLYES